MKKKKKWLLITGSILAVIIVTAVLVIGLIGGVIALIASNDFFADFLYWQDTEEEYTIKFNSFTSNGNNTYSKSVPNSQTSFSFDKEITVSDDTTFAVYYDSQLKNKQLHN